jgi:DNA (cytosine-5)-methyltransferase 1
MMENVPRLASTGKSLLNQLIAELESLDYKVTVGILRTADYGTPQSRKRLVLFAGQGFNIPIPEPTHSPHGKQGRRRWTTVREAIGAIKSDPAVLSDSKRRIGDSVEAWHIVRNLSEISKLRLEYAKPGEHRSAMPWELRPPCHQNSSRGFGNVYGRMSWDEVAPTITAGCTTLSKGRFGHPDALRTISVREAALLQEFPESYLLGTTYIDEVCDIIGNALPCGFATQMAKHVKSVLKNQ